MIYKGQGDNFNMVKTEDSKDDAYLSTFNAIEVKIPSNARVEDAIKKFRALVTRERIMSDLKEHQTYEKPSVKKRRKSREAASRVRKIESLERKNKTNKTEDEQSQE